jgi:hypothetical protein
LLRELTSNLDGVADHHLAPACSSLARWTAQA